jgi:hypothetical protein
MRDKGLERTIAERDHFEFLLKFLEENPHETSHLLTPLVRANLEHYEDTIRCAEEGKPIIASYFSNAPEIFTAMDIHWYCPVSAAFAGAGANPYLMSDLEGTDRLSVSSDVCTLLRMAMYYTEAGLLPRPDAIVGMIIPCDGIVALHEASRRSKEWRDIPIFAPDPPYFTDERSIEYFAQELRRMVEFLTELTGQKLDIGRLREVVEVSNQEYKLWQEINELRRVVPCPFNWGVGGGPFALTQNRWKGWLENEKIRLLWFDVHPTWFFDLAPWLEEEWGAIIVMDMFSYCPYTLVDTSSEETMFHDLAKRNLMDTTMIRQAVGVADNFANDIVRIVKDYSIDCVVWPAHMGHKDGAASVGIMREICRDLGVPFLSLGIDTFDPRYTTPDEVKNKMSQFFTAMDLG